MRNPFHLVAAAILVALIALAPMPVRAAADDDADVASPLAVTGDFNRDGIADIAQVTPASGDPAGVRHLTVLLGQKDGSFLPAALAPVLGSDPNSIVAGDFNGDGIPDVIVGDGGGALEELVGDGSGNLRAAGNVAFLSSVASLAMADFNHDGVLDIAVSDAHSGLVTVLLGSGKGSFHAAWAFPLERPGVAYHLAAADFNGDGLPDLAITNAADDAYEVMLSNGNGTFTLAPALSKMRDPNAHCPA